MIDTIKRKLKVLRLREQQAIKDMNFAECLKLEGAIFHIEDLYRYAMLDFQPLNAADREIMRRDFEREIYEQCDEEDRKELNCEVYGLGFCVLLGNFGNMLLHLNGTSYSQHRGCF